MPKSGQGPRLLNDSIPDEEEAETELKASAMISAIRDAKTGNSGAAKRDVSRVGDGVKILLVDHEDSFVHTLANYFRQTGADVTTVRTPVADAVFDRVNPDLVVLSPGPGSPKDFDCKATIKKGARPQPADVRRVPGAAGAGRGLWRAIAATGRSDAWQAVAHPGA